MSTSTDTPEDQRRRYGCPPWCQSKHNENDYQDTKDGRILLDHEGPRFGAYIYTDMETFVGAPDGPALAYLHADTLDMRGLNAVEARELSADLLAAAEWLEAQA